MKKLALALVVVSATAALAQHEQHHTGAKPVQKSTIVVNNGFTPATVTVKAGQPVQLTFDVKKRACATSVIFSGLKINKPLTDGKKAIVTFTPKKGTYEFACPMGMYTGKVIAK